MVRSMPDKEKEINKLYFRYLEAGHLARDFRGKDRSSQCKSWEENKHKTAECKNKRRCIICAEKDLTNVKHFVAITACNTSCAVPKKRAIGHGTRPSLAKCPTAAPLPSAFRHRRVASLVGGRWSLQRSCASGFPTLRSRTIDQRGTGCTSSGRPLALVIAVVVITATPETTDGDGRDVTVRVDVRLVGCGRGYCCVLAGFVVILLNAINCNQNICWRAVYSRSNIILLNF
uniref:Uncharacterized protein n=1 Tax=Glossina pallidipes TaxID=7398 RepID=A0A1A9ZNS1_GLOPL